MFSKSLQALAATAALVFGANAAGQDSRPDVHYPVKADVSPPLSEMLRARPPATYSAEEIKPRDIPNQLRIPQLTRRPAVDTRNDPYTQTTVFEALAPLTPGVSFNGFNNNDNVPIAGGLVAPPDTNGDVGPNHYIQYVNIGWVILDKVSGARVAGPFAGNTFWSGFGGACQTQNAGDPIVLYDKLADRWMFSQFASPAAAGGLQCVAVSTTSDPMGPYARYQFAVPGIDYPKIGLWNDAGGSTSGYYITTNNFNPGFIGSRLGVFDRSAMLAGSPTAAFISFLLPTDFFAIQPGHLENTQLPPSGTCNVFVQAWDDDVFGFSTLPDGYQFWRLCPNFATPGSSTLSAASLLPAGGGVDFDSNLCDFNACVPQTGTTQLLDTLSQFTMYRAAIQHNPRLFPGTTQMALAHTVDVGANRAALRWVQFDITNPTPAIVQQGTFDPGAAGHRWMPSAALDGDGNFAVGYSLSQTGATSILPSIRFTGRQTTDPANTLQAEQTCVAGTGVQTGTLRWGDYASMSLDPVDNCTFWFTSEWVPTTSARGWSTRVCSFRFPNCGGDRVLLNRTGGGSLNQTVCAATPTSITPIDISASLTTGGTAAITLGTAPPLPPGFTVTYAPDNLIDPSPGARQAQIAVTPSAPAGANTIILNGTSPGVQDGTLNVTVNVVSSNPSAPPTLLSPPNNALDLGVQPTFTWTAVAGSTGYTITIDDNSDFSSPVFTQTVPGTTATPAAPLPANVFLFWRVVANNGCGASAPSTSFRFSTTTPPPAAILLVDDDNNAPDVRSFYANAITASGLTFDVFNTAISDTTEPTLAQMQPYQAVVWFTGDNFASASTGPSAASVTALQTYIDGGGCFVLDSQDYIFKLGSASPSTGNAFTRDYMGVASTIQDEAHTISTGQNVFAGLGPYSHVFPTGFSNFSDTFTPGTGGVVAFTGNGTTPGPTSVTRAGARNTAFLTTSIPVLPTDQARNDVMARLIQHCGVGATGDTGVLSGTVTTRGSGAAVPAVSVSASRGGATLVRTTAPNGNYVFDPAASGFHQMTVTGANIAPASALNVQVDTGQTTDRDFQVDAAELAYDQSTLSRTLNRNQQATSPLTVSNPGTLPLNYAITIGNYGFGLPAAPSMATGRNVGTPTSTGLAAALEAPAGDRRPFQPHAPGQLLLSAPIPLTGASPLGITIAGNGDIYVSDITQGKVVQYDSSLVFERIIDDPIGPRVGGGNNATTGVAYDSVNNTLWFLDAIVPRLVESDLDGDPTGNVITLSIAAGGLATGVEYDATTDAFYLLDIVADDIYAFGRDGVVRPGYPVPQTSFDTGAGLFGNGLDVIDGNLDVLVGLSTETRVTRSVLTDLLGVSTGAETPLTTVNDTFINDIARSRTQPNRLVYVVGNATDTVYAVEPSNLGLARRWASADPATGTVPPGGSANVTLTYDSTNLAFGTYQARLSVGGNYANASGTKNLGLTVSAQPGYAAFLTAYAGADGGTQCGTPAATDTLPPLAPGGPLTLCFRFENTGDVTLGGVTATVTPLGLSLANLVNRSGTLPLAAGGAVEYYYTTSVAAAPQTITVNTSGTPQDAGGNPVPGGTVQNASDSLSVTPQGNALAATGSANPNSVLPGATSLLTVAVTPATAPNSTGITVSADLTSIGGSATQAFLDDGANGDATAGDNVFSFNATVAPATAVGLKTLAASVADAQARTASANIALNVAAGAPLLASGGANPNSVLGGGSSLLTVAVTPGTGPASTGITVTANLTSIGGSATQALLDNGTGGDATAGDGVYSFNATVGAATPVGLKTIAVSVADAQGRTATASISLNVQSSAGSLVAIARAAPPVTTPNGTTVIRVTVTPGTGPASTGIAVTANLTSIGGSATQQLFDNGTNGDTTAGDNVFSFQATVAAATPLGFRDAIATASDAQGRSGTASTTIEVRPVEVFRNEFE